MTGTYNFTVTEGEDFTPSLTWYSTGRSTPPVDLTNFTAQFIAEDGDGNPLLLVTTTPGPAGSITLGGPAGTVAIAIPAEVTAPASFTPGRYRLLVTSPADITTCILRGRFGKETS